MAADRHDVDGVSLACLPPIRQRTDLAATLPMGQPARALGALPVRSLCRVVHYASLIMWCNNLFQVERIVPMIRGACAVYCAQHCRGRSIPALNLATTMRHRSQLNVWQALGDPATACVLRLCASGVRRLQLKVMTRIGRPEVALRASAGLLVLMVGWGAVGAGAGELPPDTAATNAIFSGAAPASLLAPNGPSCIIGLNCGCIGSCGPSPRPHRAPTNDHPPDASPAPRPAPSGG